MAYGRSRGNVVMTGLGQIVGLLLGLYVFNAILTVIVPVVNATGSYFLTAVSFTVTLLPVIGILGTFYIIWRTLKSAGLM